MATTPNDAATSDDHETFDRPTDDRAWRGVGTTPDELEQHQLPDGTLEDPGAVEVPSDEPLSPDMIEQRRVVEDDDDDVRRD